MLELVQRGPAGDEVDAAIDRLSGFHRVRAGAVDEADEHGLVAGDDGGDTEDPVPVDCGGVLDAEDVARRAAQHLVEHLVGVETVGGQDTGDDIVVADVEAPVMAGGEEVPVDRREHLRPAVTDGDADQVFNEVLGCAPRDVFRIEHTTAVEKHRVFGVPTVIAGDQAVFIRLVKRPNTDARAARETIERCVDLVTGWTNLNEFKHTSIPH